MEVIESDNITDLYYKGLALLKAKGNTIESRVGKTLEITNVTSILTDIQSRLILDRDRMHSLDYIKKEFIWYMMKDTSIEFIKKASKFWEKVTDDGVNANSNYGFKIFTKFNIETQYENVLNELLMNPQSRRAIWTYILPTDYARMRHTKDFPCTVVSQFFIRDGKLNQTVYMRSCDFIYGWCNDLPFFTMIQEILARNLNVGLGTLTHIAGSLHIYERHFRLLELSFEVYPKQPQKPFPNMTDADSVIFRNYPERNYPGIYKRTKFMEFLFRE